MLRKFLITVLVSSVLANYYTYQSPNYNYVTTQRISPYGGKGMAGSYAPSSSNSPIRARTNSRANSYTGGLNRWNSRRQLISRPKPDISGNIPVTLPSEMDELFKAVMNGVNTNGNDLIAPPVTSTPEVPKRPQLQLNPWGNYTTKASENLAPAQPQAPPTESSKSDTAQPLGGYSGSDATTPKIRMPLIGRTNSKINDNRASNNDTTTSKANASSMTRSNSTTNNNREPALSRSSSASRNRKGEPKIITKSIPKYGTAKIEIYTTGIDEEKLRQLFDATEAFLDIVAREPEFKTCVLTDFI